MSCDSCTILGVPEHLCAFNKEVDVPFEENEVLYRRVPNSLPSENDKLTAEHLKQIFPLRSDSYNRSLFSEPGDVLIDHLGNHYPNEVSISLPIQEINSISFSVKDSKLGERVFSLVVRGDILDCNYSHCEIDCYQDGVKIDPNSNPRSSKQFMRNQLKNLIRFN
ncbi:hypothetical protein [Sphingobacterium sp. 2149]|uniref:hypothetical protein n=1 Tax=Sphingobacterium sp. 2149 TaxID=2817763 RepID=UPI002860C5D2|nr:hypothetical protein [Sphingobacterium sp. 2149]MDR6734168.1 hypothetical protein [Sphingobacterium sp. 2149]